MHQLDQVPSIVSELYKLMFYKCMVQCSRLTSFTRLTQWWYIPSLQL